MGILTLISMERYLIKIMFLAVRLVLNKMKKLRKIKALDGSYYRVYSTSARKGRDNLPMALDYNGVTTFHSLYNFELMDFNYWSK